MLTRAAAVQAMVVHHKPLPRALCPAPGLLLLCPCVKRALHPPLLHLALPRSSGLDQQIQTGMLARLPLMKPQRPSMQVCF